MVLESIFDETWNPILVGILAFINPVITSLPTGLIHLNVSSVLDIISFITCGSSSWNTLE